MIKTMPGMRLSTVGAQQGSSEWTMMHRSLYINFIIKINLFNNELSKVEAGANVAAT